MGESVSGPTMRRIHLPIVAAVLSVVGVAGAAWLFYSRGNGASQTKARYIKYEYRIPVRDGVTLFTQVYVPRNKSRMYPILIQRTPFGVTPYGVDRYRPQLGPSPEFDRAGYIFVFQDVRGRFNPAVSSWICDLTSTNPRPVKPMKARTWMTPWSGC